MKIIDSHQHLWDPAMFDYPWLEVFPSLRRAFRMVDYLEAAEGLEVEQSVYVEADVAESSILDEANHFLRLADQDNNPLAGVVAGGRPESTGFADYLDQIRGHRKLKGIRRVLHTQPDELGRQSVFIRNVGRLAEYRLSFDICVLAQQLPIALNLIRECPEVSFILDHCGVPDVRNRQLDPWRERIEEIAACGNVACKVSGLVAYADPENWKAEDLKPFVDHVVSCFGWDRVMFGSDWPVCTLTSSCLEWFRTLRELVAHADSKEQSSLFADNARRIYRL